MTAIWMALVGLVLLVAGAYVTGLLLPERHEGSTRVVYAATAERVWEALLDHDRHPMTGRMKKSVEALASEDGLPAWTEDMGRGEVITVRTVVAEPTSRMVREMTAQAVPMTSRWEYALEALEQGCALTLHGETHIRSGTWHVPLFRVMMVVGGGVKKGLDIQADMVAETLGVEARRE